MIVNRQRRVRISIPELEHFFNRACNALQLPADSLTICLVTPAKIAGWNRAYRGKNRPTDVLSFPTSVHHKRTKRTASRRRGKRSNGDDHSSASFASSSSSTSYLGDIAIAPVIAGQNARRFGRSFDDEMRILILHGMLHLSGYDHETDNGQMDRRERKLRRVLGLA
jgi:probable rRNA maturation factor